ncbi:MAG: hypothetical protein GKR93_03560 [Gammaproteobacteria bacterium]|nr:hypothetical protein [Gammaproteobacteria bacterium]
MLHRNIILGLLFLSFNSYAKECTSIQAYAAESVSGYLSSREETYYAYVEFGHCDDGAIAEGFSEKITLLWAENWESISEMHNYFEMSAEFESFVLKRINDETTPIDRWQVIRKNAKNECIQIASDFCRRILR